LDEIVTDMGGIKGSEKGVNTKINIHTVHEQGERFQLRIKVWYVANNPGVGNNQRQLVRGVRSSSCGPFDKLRNSFGRVIE
jgi:hypothetical protein